jgi:hypothetical protein
VPVTGFAKSQISAQPRRGPLDDRQTQAGAARRYELPAIEAFEDLSAFGLGYTRPIVLYDDLVGTGARMQLGPYLAPDRLRYRALPRGYAIVAAIAPL